MRLIDADALKAEWYRINDIDETDRGVRFVGYTEIARLIDNAPTVQADGDLISRQAVLDAINGTFWSGIEKAINNIPSAESTGAMDEAIQKYIKDGYMQPIGEDLISRQAAIESVWKLDKDANEYVVDDTKEIHGYCTAIGVCVGELSALPSAPDSRQRGEWVWKEKVDADGCYGWYECSECGTKPLLDRWNYSVKLSDFCPNCGGLMKKGD